MSVGTDLQEMENVVTKNAAAGEPMPSLTGSTPGQTGAVEDLGGPTPQNYKADDNSAKLNTPGKTLSQVRDVVNKGAKPGDQAMPTEKKFKEEEEIQGDVVAEDEVTTDEVVSEEEINIEDDVNALLGGEELTEEFKAKAKTIFEAAINSKISEIRATLEEEYAEKLAEEVAEEKEALTERVDSYLEYVSDEWMEENQLAIEHGLKTELTESFLSGMKSLFEENYVSIPEDKYDVLESMVEKLDDMETKLNEQIEKNITLNGRLAESVADGILESVSGGLAATQKEKLASLAESVEFESEETYRDKLETLKESYFTSKTSSTSKTETLTEGEAAAPEIHSGSMASYLKTLSSFK